MGWRDTVFDTLRNFDFRFQQTELRIPRTTRVTALEAHWAVNSTVKYLPDINSKEQASKSYSMCSFDQKKMCWSRKQYSFHRWSWLSTSSEHDGLYSGFKTAIDASKLFDTTPGGNIEHAFGIKKKSSAEFRTYFELFLSGEVIPSDLLLISADLAHCGALGGRLLMVQFWLTSRMPWHNNKLLQ